MTLLKLRARDCQDCPHCRSNKYYTEDSWEHAEDFWCTITPFDNSDDKDFQRKEKKFRMVAGYIAWRSEMPEVPAWCPIRADRDEAIAEENAKFQGEGI